MWLSIPFVERRGLGPAKTFTHASLLCFQRNGTRSCLQYFEMGEAIGNPRIIRIRALPRIPRGCSSRNLRPCWNRWRDLLVIITLLYRSEVISLSCPGIGCLPRHPCALFRSLYPCTFSLPQFNSYFEGMVNHDNHVHDSS